MGATDSKPVYIRPGDIHGPIVNETSGAKYLVSGAQDSGSGSGVQDSGSGFGMQDSGSGSGSGAQEPAPYPTTPMIQHSEFEMSLGSSLKTGMSQQYGTNAGSIQRQFGKTPGSIYNDSKVSFPEKVSSFDNTISFMETPIYNRFTSPLQEFDYKTRPVASKSNSVYDDTYVGSG